MNILIAGGAGYIGSQLVPALLILNHTVTVVDLLWFGNQLPPDTIVIKKDVLDLTIADLVGFDSVIFMAGLSNDPMAEYSPKNNFIANASSPAYLAYISKLAGVKQFIHAGSCSVYGYKEGEISTEQSMTTCAYPYGISKLQGEIGCMQLADTNFTVIGLRQGTVCGYSPRMRYDLVLNTMVKDAAGTQLITVNNPEIWRPILSIGDAVDAYIAALNYKKSGIFNIATNNYTVLELAKKVVETLSWQIGDISIIINQVKDLRNYKVSTKLAESELGFKPSESIANELNTLFHTLPQDIDNWKYYNIRTFKQLDI